MSRADENQSSESVIPTQISDLRLHEVEVFVERKYSDGNFGNYSYGCKFKGDVTDNHKEIAERLIQDCISVIVKKAQENPAY